MDKSLKQNFTLHNNNNIKNIITSKFKEKLCYHKELHEKRELRYYKEVTNLNEVINLNLKYQKYLFILISVKKKINFAKKQQTFTNVIMLDNF